MAARRVPLTERFWAKIAKSDSCWEWMGGKSNGYGMIRTDAPERKMRGAHVISYEMAHGPVPPEMKVDHRCHNPGCVNPEHLRAVSSKQNREHLAGPSRNNKSGHLGVYESFPGRWRGKVKHHNRSHYTPTFDTPEEAAEAARQLRLSLFTHNDADRRSA